MEGMVARSLLVPRRIEAANERTHTQIYAVLARGRRSPPVGNCFVVCQGSKVTGAPFFHRFGVRVLPPLGKRAERGDRTRHPDIQIELSTSADSNENIDRLEAGEAEIALVQNDIRGGGAVRSIVGLYSEVLHLLCRNDAGIQALSDLEGKSIGVGAVGSGTEQLASVLLSFVRISLASSQLRRLKFSDAIAQLQSGELEAGFFLTGSGQS